MLGFAEAEVNTNDKVAAPAGAWQQLLLIAAAQHLAQRNCMYVKPHMSEPP
jgi:hypothetical protein